MRPVVCPALCLATILPDESQGADRIAAMPKINPFRATLEVFTPDDFALLSSAVAERRCRDGGQPMLLDKALLRGLAGMEVKYLQSHLSWYVCLFRLRQTSERWTEIAMVAHHLLMVDAHFRSKT